MPARRWGMWEGVEKNGVSFPLKGGVITAQDRVEQRVSVTFTVSKHQRCLKQRTQLSVSV